MQNTIRLLLLTCSVFLLSACHEVEHSDREVLEISYQSPYNASYHWTASLNMIFAYYRFSYSQPDILDYYHYSTNTFDIYLHDIGWLLWELGDLDSDIIGTLTKAELYYELNQGKPVLLHYYDDFGLNDKYIVIHGHDHHGHFYLHEPGYGTRLVHYNDLFSYSSNGKRFYWESSILIR